MVNMKKIKVLLLMGGGGTEHEVSLKSGNEALNNFDLTKYEVIPMVLEDKIIDISEVKKINPEIVFIMIHGSIGEDGTIQRILEKEKIKFVGCGSEASEIGMDKIKFKKLMEDKKMPVPKGIILTKGEVINLEKIKNISEKLVIKPATQGSSVGVSIIDDITKIEEATKEAFKYDDQILVEEFIKGIEVSCGLLEDKILMALPVIEICPKNDFFDYEAKYTADKCEEIVPARLSNEVTNKVQNLSKEVFRLIDGKGFARVDFIISEDQPIILEINTIPGFTQNSLLPKEAKSMGINYSELLDKIIQSAL